MPYICRFIRIFTIVAMVIFSVCGALRAGDPIEDYLLKKLTDDPTHADSWRLLGRVYQKRGDHSAAKNAFEKSLANDPYSAAALFDYGQLIANSGDPRGALPLFEQVYEIAPQSEYADQLRQMGVPEPAKTAEDDVSNAILYETLDPDEVLAANYEIQTFDSSEELERRVRQAPGQPQEANDLRFFMEAGVLYNTNVTLAPISRQLSDIDAASFQAFANPEIEWIAIRKDGWNFGPLVRGFFNINEKEFSEFNLASFQPGLFAENEFGWNGYTFVNRLDYVYSLDFFDGNQIGDRHALTASATALLANFDAIYAYVTASYSQFEGPVADPSIDSLDGPGITAGVSRFFRTDIPWLPTWSLGTDIEYVNTTGDNYRYFGAKVHGDLTFRLTEKLDFIPQGNIGFRQYPDYTDPGGRDELVYRLSSRLKYRFTERISTSLVVNYDRFASDADAFDTERFETGIVTTIMY